MRHGDYTVKEAIHTAPVWRDRADFVIAARIPDGGELAFEQLWSRHVEGRRFQLCCIPFYLYHLALGDIVETDEDYTVSRVVKPSGRYVFRVWFGESDPVVRARVAESLGMLGALLEWQSARLIAVDARDQEHAQAIATFLTTAETQGELVYETGS